MVAEVVDATSSDGMLVLKVKWELSPENLHQNTEQRKRIRNLTYATSNQNSNDTTKMQIFFLLTRHILY